MNLSKKQEKIKDWLLSKPGYLKSGLESIRLTIAFSKKKRDLKPCSSKDVEIALKEAKRIYKEENKSSEYKNSKNVPWNEKESNKIMSEWKRRKDIDSHNKKVDDGYKKLTPVKIDGTFVKNQLVKKIEVKSKSKIDEKKADELIEKVESKPKKIVKFKRLFFDIETSPNVVFSWRVGYKLMIPHDNILKERAIISIAWKFQGDNKVSSLSWDKGDDKQMLVDFIKILNTSDEVIGHNSDNFDLKWLRTRCIFHGIEMFPDYTQIDTLKLAKAGFNFNSNKLDYLGDFLGVGKKMSTGGFSLWKSIILDNDSKAMDKMIKYNKVDVIRLEQIYDKLNPYSKHKTHVGVYVGNPKCSCPNCASLKTTSKGKIISAVGFEKRRMQCQDCGKYFRVSKTDFENREK